MRLIYITIWNLIFISCANAACTRNESVPEVRIDMAMGKILVNPDLPVNSIIKSKTWVMPETRDFWAWCEAGTVLDAIITGSNTEFTNKIYSTNIPGIGLRFTRSGPVSFTYPDTFTIKKTDHIYLFGSTFTLDVIKTAQETGSGSIQAGEYTRYGYLPNSGITPALTTYLSLDAITIISPSCKVSGGNTHNVYLSPIPKHALSGIGSVAGNTEFTLNIKCHSNSQDTSSANIKVSFSGVSPSNLTNLHGVLSNNATWQSKAKGVGIQIIDSQLSNPIVFNNEYILGNLNKSNFSLNYIARYYQYENSITTGLVKSTMMFNIDYE